MRQPAFIVATLTGSLLFGASVAGAMHAPVIATSAAIAMPAHSTPSGRAAANAAAEAQPQVAALAAAIQDQFPGHAVEVVLDKPMLADAGPAQQEVEVLARVRIDGSAPMPVRAVALYDREARSIAAPSLWFEAAGAQPAGDPVRRSLLDAATHRLDAEFADQPFTLALADAEATRVGGRYLRVVARGTADFGAEGRAATTIEALYDPRNGEWLRLDYALGADPAGSPASDGFAYAGD
jgi:hypothetical protein